MCVQICVEHLHQQKMDQENQKEWWEEGYKLDQLEEQEGFVRPEYVFQS